MVIGYVFISLIKHTVCIFNSMLASDSIYTSEALCSLCAENALNAVRLFSCSYSMNFPIIIIHKKNRLAREFHHKKCTISHFYHSCLMLNDAGNFSVCFSFVYYFSTSIFPIVIIARFALTHSMCFL